MKRSDSCECGAFPSATIFMQIQLRARNQAYAFDVSSGESILFAGIRQGLELPYGCASGTCGNCRVTCMAGRCSTTWKEAPGSRVGRQGPNDLLMCQSTPLDEAVVETAATVYRADPGACLPGYCIGRIADVRLLARDMMAFSLALDVPMSYEAGQFVALEVPGLAGYRVYSITNFARATGTIDLLVKRKPGGGFSEWLFSGSHQGVELNVFGPLGRATFSPSAGKHLLIVAGGSGIAGMMAILVRAVQEGYFERHRGHVFFGVRTWLDHFFLSELSEMKNAFPKQLSVTIALSDEGVPSDATVEYPALTFARGFVHDVARASMVGNYVNTRAYVAGPPQAVDATLRYLIRDAKLTPADIRYDKFG
jgi:toluene monooxygenase electron transfer component